MVRSGRRGSMHLRWIVALLLPATALAACSADEEHGPPPALRASGDVEPGRENAFRSEDGQVEVTIPGDSVTGTGTLAITASEDAEGRAGWLIDLEGTELTGPATLRFTLPDLADGEPLPLVRRAPGPGEPAAPVEQGTVDGDQLVVTTDHFSTWFLDTWGSVLDEAKAWLGDKIDQALSLRGEGKHPKCAGEDAVREDGYKVGSDNGRRVYWCFGEEGGKPTLKVVNARGYGVAAEATPGVTVAGRDRDDFIATWAELFTPPPDGRGNTVELLAPGGGATYRVNAAAGKTVGVKVEPNPGAYLLTALQFAADTFTMVMTRTGAGKTDDLVAQLNKVLGAGDCLTEFSGLATNDLTSPADALAFFENALGLALSCVGDAAEEMDFGLIGSTIIGPVVWLFSGLSTAVTGLVGAAESLDMDGYQILITAPEAPDPLFVPGGFGELRAGMTAAEALRTGLPERRKEGTCNSTLWMRPAYDYVSMAYGYDVDEIYLLFSFDDQARTEAGVGVGSTLAELEAAYGSELAAPVQNEYHQGVAVWETDEGFVSFVLPAADSATPTSEVTGIWAGVGEPTLIFEGEGPC